VARAVCSLKVPIHGLPYRERLPNYAAFRVGIEQLLRHLEENYISPCQGIHQVPKQRPLPRLQVPNTKTQELALWKYELKEVVIIHYKCCLGTSHTQKNFTKIN